jgi:hypothetical protein
MFHYSPVAMDKAVCMPIVWLSGARHLSNLFSPAERLHVFRFSARKHSLCLFSDADKPISVFYCQRQLD